MLMETFPFLAKCPITKAKSVEASPKIWKGIQWQKAAKVAIQDGGRELIWLGWADRSAYQTIRLRDSATSG